MAREQLHGVVDKVAGKVQEAVGEFNDDDATRAEGKARSLAGDAQIKYGDALDRVRLWAADGPIRALAISAGLGALFGAILARRDDD